MKNIVKILMVVSCFGLLVSQGVYDSYDIPSYEYRSFSVSGQDLFSMHSQGDISETHINAGADYSFASQSPDANCSYGLDFNFNSDDVDEVATSAYGIDVPFDFDKYLVGGNKGGFGFASGNFDFYGGDTYPETHNEDDAMDLNLTVGAGYGRVVSARPVAQAYAIADAVGNTDDATILAIAAVIGAAGSYSSIYKDDAEEMFYNDLADAAGDSGSAMQIRKILSSPAYNISDRSIGWSVQAGLSNNYIQCDDCEDKGDLSAQAAYAMPMGLDAQFVAGFTYDQSLNDDAGNDINLSATYSLDHDYSWATRASFGYSINTPDGVDMESTNTMSLEVSSTKAILNQLAATASFEYSKDSEADDASMDINVSFTYFVF